MHSSFEFQGEEEWGGTEPVRYGRCIVKGTNLDEVSCGDLIARLQAAPYTRERGAGFAVQSSFQSSTMVYYIRDQVMKRSRFDPQTMAFVEEVRDEWAVTPFILDWDEGTVAIFGTKNSASELLTSLGKESGYTLTVADISFDISRVLTSLRTACTPFTIRSIRVADYEVSPGLVVDFTANMARVTDGMTLLDRFASSIISIAISARVYGQSVSINVHNQGVINIGVEPEEDPEAYQTVKRCLMEGASWGKSKQ